MFGSGIRVCPLLCPFGARGPRFPRSSRAVKTKQFLAIAASSGESGDMSIRFCKPKVGGSIPSSGTNQINSLDKLKADALAVQLAGVTGGNAVTLHIQSSSRKMGLPTGL